MTGMREHINHGGFDDAIAKSAENFLGIWTANICQRYDVRTPIDGIRGMVEISRHHAENAVDHLSAYEAGRWFILYENI